MEPIIDWNVIPAWVVGVNLILAGFMWLVTRKTKIRLDSRIWGNTYVWMGVLFLLSYLRVNAEPHLEQRVIAGRLLISIMAFSQWFPLLISYLRNIHRTRMATNGTVAGDNHPTDSDS